MDHPHDAAAAPRGRAPSGGELAGLGVFLAAAVIVPLLIGVSQVWLVVGGIAIAQLVLAGFAVREALAG